MAGDTENPRIWTGADVYVGDTDAAAPTNTTTALGVDWEALGLLSDEGISESRDEDVTDHYAYGGVLVRTTRSKHKRTITVTALEDNPVVYDLKNPGSAASTTLGVTTRTVVVPSTTNPKSFVFELVDGDIVKRRYIPRAEVVEVGEENFSASEMATCELTINVYPVTVDGTDNVLYLDITDDPQAAVVGP